MSQNASQRANGMKTMKRKFRDLGDTSKKPKNVLTGVPEEEIEERMRK